MWLIQECDTQSQLLEAEKENSSHIRRLGRLVRTAQRNRYMWLYLDILEYMRIYKDIYYEGFSHMVMEYEKSCDWLSGGWRPREDGV